MALGNFDG